MHRRRVTFVRRTRAHVCVYTCNKIFMHYPHVASNGFRKSSYNFVSSRSCPDRVPDVYGFSLIRNTFLAKDLIQRAPREKDFPRAPPVLLPLHHGTLSFHFLYASLYSLFCRLALGMTVYGESILHSVRYSRQSRASAN